MAHLDKAWNSPIFPNALESAAAASAEIERYGSSLCEMLLWDSISCQALLRIVCNFVSPLQSKELNQQSIVKAKTIWKRQFLTEEIRV
jgi:hypothetical protein